MGDISICNLRGFIVHRILVEQQSQARMQNSRVSAFSVCLESADNPFGETPTVPITSLLVVGLETMRCMN
jgi:hypothetical protein